MASIGQQDPATTPLADSDLLLLDQAGTTKHINLADFMPFGDDSSGNYVQFPNGMMLCWAYGNTLDDFDGVSAGHFEWQFPQPFAVAPVVIGTAQQSPASGRILILSSVTAVAAEGYRYNTTDNNASSGFISLLAMGRWR